MKQLIVVALLILSIGCSKKEADNSNNPTGSSSASGVSIVSQSYKITEKNSAGWYFSCKAQFKNNDSKSVQAFFHIKFLDGQKYVIDDNFRDIKLAARETKTYSELIPMKTAQASKVQLMKIIITDVYDD